MDEQSLGRHLQSARTRAGLTQQELCQKAEISYSTLAKIERGAIQSPSIFTIQKLAEVLDLSLDALLTDVPSKRGLQTKHSKNGIDFVYFDINGCLVRFFHSAFTELSRDYGIDTQTVETLFWRCNDAVCRGEMSMLQFNEQLARVIGATKVDWKEYYLRAVDPIESAHEVLTWVAENYRVGLLSNIMPDFIPDMIQLGLLPDIPYAAIIDSSQVNAIKPEAQIYSIAESHAGVNGDKILFIDDSRTNLIAAARLGWRVIWFDDFEPEESVERIKKILELN